MRTFFRAFFMVLLAALAVVGCSVDETIIENKLCTTTASKPECISGYSCICANGKCSCQKNASSSSSSLSEESDEANQDSVAASLRLLQRQGVLPSSPAPQR